MTGAPAGVLDFARGTGWRCVANLTDTDVTLPPGELLLAGTPLPQPGTLPPDTTVWLA